MKLTHPIATLAAGVLLALGLQAPALATAIVTNTTFNFSGNCEDCASSYEQPAFGVTGSLVLSNYTLGNAISNSNFVSFAYGGSNLVNPFGVNNFNLISVSGSMTDHTGGAGGPNSGPDSFYLVFGQGALSGYWFQSIGSIDSNVGSAKFQLCAPVTPGNSDTTDCRVGVSNGGGDKDVGHQAVWTGPNLPIPNSNDVPEPGSLALLGLGLIALAGARRKFRA